MQIKYKGLAADWEVIDLLKAGITVFSTCYEEDYSNMYGKAICIVRKLLSKSVKVEKGKFISSTLYVIPRKRWDFILKKYGVDVILRTWLNNLVGKSWTTSNVVETLKQTIDELGKSVELEDS